LIIFQKKLKSFILNRNTKITFFAILVCIIFELAAFKYMNKDIIIVYDGKTIISKTIKLTVGSVLEENEINIGPYDYINLPLDSELNNMKQNEIVIKKAIPINISLEGKETILMTYESTVENALKNIKLGYLQNDKVEGVNLSDKIVPNMKIKIIRVKEEISTETIKTPYKLITRENSSMNKGYKKVLREGKEGVREKTLKTIFQDGKEIAKQVIEETFISNPIDMIVEVGTILNKKTSRGDSIRYKKVLNMTATGYTASFKDTGKKPGDKGFGITYTGTKVKKGVIAVDPKIIPLGTRVYVESVGNSSDYGYAIAADIGGAIKGNIIDLYYDTSEKANNWGRRKVKVYVLQN